MAIEDADKSADSISHNVESIATFYEREERKISRSQRIVERVADTVGRPTFLGCIVLVVAAWVALNSVADRLGIEPFDEPPFFWLQGLISLLALMVQDRHDAQSEAMQKPTDLHRVLAEIDEARLAAPPSAAPLATAPPATVQPTP